MRDYVSKIAKDLKPSGIRKFFDLCAGSPDIISLGVGEPDFVTPWQISSAGINAIKQGRTTYTANAGLLDLRKEICDYLKRFNLEYKPNEVMVTIGASEAIDISLRAIINPGDEILVPDPSYVSYAPCIELWGGVPVSVECVSDNGFILTPEKLEAVITEKTKALIFPYPNNPTGGIMAKEEIERIIPVLKKHEILVISDEIYAELTYGGNQHVSICSFDIPCVLINGFSKAFAMTGWRVGYICCKGDLYKAMLKIHQYSIICAPIFSQYAALEGLKKGKLNDYAFVKEMRDEYDRRRIFMYNSFNEMGLSCFEPRGAFYIMPCVKSLNMDGQEFALKLLEKKKVAVVPGDAFGQSGKYFFRCSYAYSMKSLIKAVSLIREFVEETRGEM